MSLLIDLGNFVRQLLPALTTERRTKAQEFLGGIEAADADREMTIGRRFIREDYGLDPAQRQEFDSHLAGMPDPKRAAQEIIADDLLSHQFGIEPDAVQRHRG